MPKRRAPYFDETLQLYVGQVDLGRDGTGKRVRPRVSAKTYEECLRKLEQLERGLADGTVLASAPEKITVEAWAKQWLEGKRASLEPNTRANYRSNVTHHIVPRIGALLLRKVTPLHLKLMFDAMERGDKQSKGKKVGRRAQQHVYDRLRQLFDDAVGLGLIAKSPLTEAIKRPPLDQTKRKPRLAWTVEDVRAFLTAAERHPHEALFALAVGVGMRESELFGLLWENVDLDRGSLRVEWVLHEVNQEDRDPQHALEEALKLSETLAMRPPKTLASRRTIPLPLGARDALIVLRARFPTRTGLVFLTPEGEPIRGAKFADDWREFLDEMELPPLPFGHLRHTCLTVLAEEGVPVKAAQALAGHSTPAVTQGIYQRATARMARQAADAVDRAFWPDRQPSIAGDA